MSNLVERRGFLIASVATLALVFLDPKTVLTQASQGFPEAFPWRREEVLFGDAAGFMESRANIPVGVYTQAAIVPEFVEVGMGVWNRLAREFGRNDFFYSEPDMSEAKIIIVPSVRDRVIAEPSYLGPYTKCTVELISRSSRFAAHELGHTLGLVDFVFATTNLAGLV